MGYIKVPVNHKHNFLDPYRARLGVSRGNVRYECRPSTFGFERYTYVPDFAGGPLDAPEIILAGGMQLLGHYPMAQYTVREQP